MPWRQQEEIPFAGSGARIGMAEYRPGHVNCWFIHAADTRSRASSSANATKMPALPSPTPAVHCAPSSAPSPRLTASTPSSTPPKPCPSAVSRRARLRPFLGPNEIDRAGQRTLAGVAFRRRARGTPHLRPTRAGGNFPVAACLLRRDLEGSFERQSRRSAKRPHPKLGGDRPSRAATRRASRSHRSNHPSMGRASPGGPKPCQRTRAQIADRRNSPTRSARRQLNLTSRPARRGFRASALPRGFLLSGAPALVYKKSYTRVSRDRQTKCPSTSRTKPRPFADGQGP